MELLQYWRIVKKRWWLILLLAVVAGGSALFYVQQQAPMYTTSTTLFLNPAAPSALLPYEGASTVKSLANTYREYMRTRSFASLVAQELDAPMSEEAILKALSTHLVPDTQFFRISSIHSEPQVAQDLANTAAEVLIAENAARQRAQREQIEAQRDPSAELERQQLLELQKSLQDELAYVGDRIESLQGQIADLEGRPPSAETDQQILDLREELVRHQSLRVELYGSLAQAQTALANTSDGSSSLSVDTAVVVDRAPLPEEPQSRQLVQNVLLAVVTGLGLGVGLTFLLDYIDYTIKTPEELDAVYGQGTLGVIGAFKEGNGKRGNPRNPEDLVTLHHPRSPIAEAFRALRTNIQFASPGQPLRSLMVTSAGPVEGKTCISANLAIVLAQGSHRVILVDADLRRPRQHYLFDVPREPGFTDLVVDPKDGVEEYLRPTPQENLRVLPCGPLPRNPAELLGSARAAQVMEQIREQADVVIYDSPPAATVTDAVVLGSRVDGVIQVVQAGRTRRDVVQRAKTALEKVGAQVLGPVLNQVSSSDMGYYAYYYYGYYHEGRDGHEAEKRSPLLRRLRRRKHADAKKRKEA